MLKTFPIDFVRQAFEQKMLEEHNKDLNFFGGKNQVNIFSFYEQLKSQEQVDRFVEMYRYLSDQQNRSGLILNGVLVAPENPTITNLYSSTIIPMTWTCSMRCNVLDRDQSIVTINNLIDKLKGKKVDIAQLNGVDEDGKKYYEPFIVGTIGQNDGEPSLKNGDYLENISVDTFDSLVAKGISIDLDRYYYLYSKNNDKLTVNKVKYYERGEQFDVEETETISIDTSSANFYKVNVEITVDKTVTELPRVYSLFSNITLRDALDNPQHFNAERGYIDYENSIVGDDYIIYKAYFLLLKVSHFYPTSATYNNTKMYEAMFSNVELQDDGSVSEIIFPPEHESFEKYKMSFSFDAIRCDEPRNLNEKEYCELSFGGSATLVSNGVQLGNDLLKIYVAKNKIVAQSTIDFSTYENANHWYLEPLEMPSGSNANTQLSQLVSNNFLNNSHTDALSLTLQYTFIYNKEIDILKQWFNYARYGIVGVDINSISPNMEYKVNELWCSWGEYEKKEVLTRIVENIDIENTESDVLTLSLTMQIQGENDY